MSCTRRKWPSTGPLASFSQSRCIRIPQRCPAKVPESEAAPPPLVETEPGHFSACVRALEMARIGPEGLGLARASLLPPAPKAIDRTEPLMSVRGLKTHFE